MSVEKDVQWFLDRIDVLSGELEATLTESPRRTDWINHAAKLVTEIKACRDAAAALSAKRQRD